MKYFSSLAFVCLLLVGCSPTCPFNCCTPPKAEPAIVTPSSNDHVSEDVVVVTESLDNGPAETSVAPATIGNTVLRGKVAYSDDGSPVPTGIICFETGTFLARGTIKSDGTYVISSSLPLGIYHVYIHGAEKTVGLNADGEPIVEPLIDSRWTDPARSGLAIDITLTTKTVDILVDRFLPTSVVGHEEPTAPVSEPAEEKAWTPLFDGKSLAGWAVPVYGGDGTVEVQEGNLVIGRGEMMTGIRYEKEFPKIDYEIQYEARRTSGYDFFAACTFPVNDSFCTFVNGGWGGGTIGLSSINGYDASENSSSSYHNFKESMWYRFRIRVTNNRISVWITPQDKEGNWETEAVRVDVTIEEGTALSTRMEMNLYKPLGFCTWSTEGQLRNILYRSH